MNQLDNPEVPFFKCLVKVPRHSSKKNEKQPAKRGRRSFIMKTAAARHVEGVLCSELRKQRFINRAFEPVTGDVWAQFTFFFPKSVYFTKKGQRSKKIPDLSNLYLLPEDCLQKVGIIEDDTQVESHDGSRRAPIDGDQYWLEIKLYRL